MSRMDARLELQERQAPAIAARLADLLAFRGNERALDVGAGTGALAFAFAEKTASVVALEIDEAAAAQARAAAPVNCEVVVGDGEQLPFADGSFDIAGTMRMLHHTPHPELVVAELARVTKAGGSILVADQLGPDDPLAALELNRFECARDGSTTRVLSAPELRALFEANELRLLREREEREPRDLESYLDLAGCEGPARESARSLVPTGYEALVGWYVLER
jgi:ubiquinone/menaquinone biosynthesis C-methylase UbiE